MHGLPKNSAGYPIPFFVHRSPDDGGNPDFRIMSPSAFQKAITWNLCWVCGTKMTTKEHTFVVGPMCLVNHVSAEPPCHRRCAEWSAIACPFLSNPKKVRRDANLPENYGKPGGEMIERNPGVAACVVMASPRHWGLMMTPTGPVIRFAIPAEVTWWAHGRPATREEVQHSIDTGLPILQAAAAQEGMEDALADGVAAMQRWLPAVLP